MVGQRANFMIGQAGKDWYLVSSSCGVICFLDGMNMVVRMKDMDGYENMDGLDEMST